MVIGPPAVAGARARYGRVAISDMPKRAAPWRIYDRPGARQITLTLFHPSGDGSLSLDKRGEGRRS